MTIMTMAALSIAWESGLRSEDKSFTTVDRRFRSVTPAGGVKYIFDSIFKQWVFLIPMMIISATKFF